VVELLVNIPVIISVSIATVLLPNLSPVAGQKSGEEVKSLIEKAFQICLSIAIACFIGFVVFGEQILEVLYGGTFDNNELTLGVKLLFLGGFNIVFLSLVQVSSGVLQGLGFQKEPVKSLLLGCIIKIVLDVCLILIPTINIMGAIIAGGACYVVVFIRNYTKIRKVTGASVFNSYGCVSMQACFVALFAYFSNTLFKLFFSDMLALFCAGIVSVIIYLVTYYLFFMLIGEKKSIKAIVN